jgi:ABC-type Fe3+/spermidine/putrescine transport system ATPase subunit
MAPVVELESVSKLYGTFVALRKISLNLEQGRCCVLLGEMARANRHCCG